MLESVLKLVVVGVDVGAYVVGDDRVVGGVVDVVAAMLWWRWLSVAVAVNVSVFM
jgi:hypothetical protein